MAEKLVVRHLHKVFGPQPALAMDLLRQGRTDDAILAFGEAMALDPDNGVAVMNMASARFERRDYDQAAPLFVRAQAMRLPDVVKLRALAERHARRQETAERPVPDRVAA